MKPIEAADLTRGVGVRRAGDECSPPLIRALATHVPPPKSMANYDKFMME